MQFMVEGTLKQAHTAETLSLIPAEVARGNELEAQGLRKMIYVAADLSEAWQVYQVAAKDELDGVLATFPLHPYIEYRVTPLADDMH